MNERKIFILTFSLCIVVILLLAFFTYTVNQIKLNSDRPLAGIDGRQYSSIAIRKFNFNAIIAGSSMAQCFKCSEFDSAFGNKSIKLTLSACNIAEIRFLLDFASRYHKINRVMFDLSPIFLHREQTLSNIEQGYYSKNPDWFLFRKSFSFDFFAEAFEFVSRICRGKVKYTNWDDIYRWDKTRPCSEKYFAKALLYKDHTPDDYSSDKLIKKAEKNIAVHLLPLLEKYSETEFLIFFPPFSIMEYRGGNVDEYIKFKSRYVDTLLRVENVKIYDFETAFQITEDFNNYKDLRHYSSKINSWMISCMKRGDYLVTGDNKDMLLEKFRSRISAYDYQKAYDRLKSVYGK